MNSEVLVPIRAICFDLGKVLIDFDWQIMLRRIAAESPYTPAEITQIMSAKESFLQYETGRIGSDPYFVELKERLAYRETPEQLRVCFTEIFTPLTVHIELARRLSAHYPLAIISNTNEAHITYAESRYDFFPLFQQKIYSYQVGTMKPLPAIYQAAQAGFGKRFAADELLFIDDLAPNIAGARDLGWNTIHLKPETDLAAELSHFQVRGLEPAPPL